MKYIVVLFWINEHVFIMNLFLEDKVRDMNFSAYRKSIQVEHSSFYCFLGLVVQAILIFFQLFLSPNGWLFPPSGHS